MAPAAAGVVLTPAGSYPSANGSLDCFWSSTVETGDVKTIRLISAKRMTVFLDGLGACYLPKAGYLPNFRTYVW